MTSYIAVLNVDVRFIWLTEKDVLNAPIAGGGLG
jgi:hypothetical protein|nr:MAG TPA: hypothetical protein [Caudoviricetes sp.]